MKTQLIQLNPSDDVISVRDKMGWSQTSRILLVWPEQGGILTRRLDLLLLQRHSNQLGAQLALVTRSMTVREVAQELHIPVFQDSRQAQNTRWRGRRWKPFIPRRPELFIDVCSLRLQRMQRKTGWTEHPIVRYSLFGISIMALLAVVLLFLPAARINLQPETEIQAITLPVSASTAYATVNLAGYLPAQIQRVVVEGRASLPTSGSILIPGDPATGMVLFTNLTNQVVRIPQGLIISTLDANPIRFFTTKAGVVAAGPGRTLSLQVQALVPGEKGNLVAGSLVAIEGELGLSLSVTNRSSTRGGTDVPAPAPREWDRQTLLRQLTTTLRNSALADLENNLAEGDLLLSTSLELTNTLEETYIPPGGLPGDVLELILRLEYQAMAVRNEALQALAVPVLDGSLADGLKALPETLTLVHTRFSKPDAEGIVHWTLNAQRSVVAEIPPADAIQLVVGQPVESAVKLLTSNLPLADAPQVELSPPWLPRLPYLPFRIHVITE
jgi:hypothetical protein